MAEPGMHKGDEFAGKVALVTGAARNIGRAVALSLASGGAKVAVGTRANLEQARGVVSEIKALGSDAEAFTAELADPESPALVRRMVRAVLHEGRDAAFPERGRGRFGPRRRARGWARPRVISRHPGGLGPFPTCLAAGPVVSGGCSRRIDA